MSTLEERIAFITEMVEELTEKEAYESAYTFGVCQGLMYAKDILDDKDCDDRTQLKWPEQFSKVTTHDVSFVIAALAIAISSKDDPEAMYKMTELITDKLSKVFNLTTHLASNNTFVSLKKDPFSVDAIDDLKKLLTDQEASTVSKDDHDNDYKNVTKFLLERLTNFLKEDSFYTTSYHFGSMCQLIEIYNKVTGSTFPSPPLPKVFRALMGQDVLLAAATLSSKNLDDEETQKIYSDMMKKTQNIGYQSTTDSEDFKIIDTATLAKA